MKRYIFSLLLSVACTIASVSCKQELLGVTATSNSADNKEIHFIQSSMTKEFPRETKEGIIAVTLARQGNKGTYRVVLQKTGKDADLFTLKDTVVIPDGSYSVDVPVLVKMSSVVLGSTVEANLAIVGRDAQLGDDSAYISQYSDFMKLSASFSLEWEPYMRTTESGESVQQTATYYFSQFYEGVQSDIPVEVATGTDNIFRLVDWASGTNFMFKVDWSKKTVVVPGQSIGYYNDSVGQYVFVSDLAQYLGDDSIYSNYPCTWDGDRTFDINVIYYVDAGFYGYGPEKIVFAGDHDTDPVVEVEYKGAGEFAFTCNEFVKSCKAVVVSGDIASDAAKVKEIYESICKGTATDVRTFTEDTQTWTPESVQNTLVTVPFDEKGVPGKAVAVRFTYDPKGEVTPEIVECVLSAAELDPYTTISFELKTKNVGAARFILLPKDILDYYVGNFDLELLFSRLGGKLSADQLDEANSEAGVHLYYQNAVEGEKYGMLLEVSNKYGDVVMETYSVKLSSHAERFVSKSIDDFTGAFLMSATVTDDEDQTTGEAFRVDIVKTGENTVSIKGLSNYKNFSPAITGTFIPEENCIRIHPQSLGEFSYMNVTFGFVSNLYTGIWDKSLAMEFGFAEDDYIYFRAMAQPDKEDAIVVNGYKFLLFDGSQYSGYALGGKTYTDLLMMKIDPSQL